MNKPSKKKAIELLTKSIEQMSAVRNNALNTQQFIKNPDFIRWETTTKSRIEIIFGKGSDNYSKFESIIFSPTSYDHEMPTTIEEYKNSLIGGCDEAFGLLSSMLDQVHDQWPDDEKIVIRRQFETGMFKSVHPKKVFISMKLEFDGANTINNKINQESKLHGFDPKKDLVRVKTCTEPVTQKVIDKVNECGYMLQVYDSDEGQEHFTWLFFEYAIARTLERKIVRIVEKKFVGLVTVDRDIPLIPFDRSSREKEPVEKAIKEAFNLLFDKDE